MAEATGRNIAGSEVNDNDEEVEEAVYDGEQEEVAEEQIARWNWRKFILTHIVMNYS